VWLVRDGEVLAAAELASTRRARGRGLLGRDGIDGAIVLRPCRQVHTIGMRFPIDVAFCGADGVVRHVARLRRYRISRPVLRAAFAIEAEAGAFERWGLREGDRVEVKE
jgi:uncharacterized membrane protein (UPF0127 family)